MAVLCFAKLGAGSAHHLAYLFIIWTFSAKQTSFVFASSNLLSRLITTLAPEIGELKEPMPMLIMASTATLCGALCYIMYFNIIKNEKKLSV